ncbi:MAG: WXG100 family type VII secretion target [Actinomycetia bacterium]|nr:WXG100 family type VII secretion target [Actinomycetes bacterium]
MAKLAVQSEDLRNQSTAVKTGANEVSDILSRLTGQISDLAARWEGGASAAFQTRWQEWQQGAQNVRQAMEDMGIFLEQAAQAYEDTEESLRQAAGR